VSSRSSSRRTGRSADALQAPLAFSTGQLAVWASLLEASARKPGNVHPEASFHDTSYMDFVLSAAAIGPVFEDARRRTIGSTILRAVEQTQAVVGKNTNLGIILLLAPLARVLGPPRTRRSNVPHLRTATKRRAARRELASRLRKLTRRDAEQAYRAIRLAAPGGLGTAEEGDVHGAPVGTLYDMMKLAAPRDLVARQYCGAYREVIEDELPAFQRDVRTKLTLEQSIVRCFLRFLANHGDSLIARKSGKPTAAEAARRATAVLAAGWPHRRRSAATWSRLDQWLRKGDGARNPGTSADLTAAVLFLALQSGIIQRPFTFVKAHGMLPSSSH
jgi:triphosphoribosyl-dephospho-CoA synthase